MAILYRIAILYKEEYQGMKIHFMDLGHMCCDKNSLVAGSVKSSIDDHSPACIWAQFPVWAMYIDHPMGKIVFDAGCTKDAMRGGWAPASMKFTPYSFTPDQTIEHQLKLCGVTPEEIDYVVISHMHLDHAGNIGLFKNAKIIVQREELQSALMVTHTVAAKGTYIKADVDVDANWMLIDGDYKLFDDVKLISLPGHAAGQMGIQLDLENNGTFLVVSDACYTSVNYGPPAQPTGKVADSKSYFVSMEKLRKIANETNATVIFGHDDKQFSSIKKAPEYYD